MITEEILKDIASFDTLANETVDVVNRPTHYCPKDGMECIDVMELLFGRQAVIDFCRCNIFKYRFRAESKNGAEDIKKAQWYEKKIKELLEKQ